MDKTVSCTLPLAVLLAVSPGVTQAAPIEVPSHVAAATVFSDRALVTRVAKVHVPAGSQTVSVADLPSGINESTLRVQGAAAVAVKIGAVEVKHIFLAEAANADERNKQTQIDAKNAELAGLQAEIDALNAKQDFIRQIVAAAALKHDSNGNASLDFTPEKWQQGWTLVHTGLNETGKELAIKTAAMAKLDAELGKLKEELTQMRSHGAKQRRDANINIEATAETDLDLKLTYQTAGASWQPVYDARLDTAGGKLELEQYGSVVQVTGEEWQNVEITLSTARPAVGSEMPSMREWWLRLFQPDRAGIPGGRTQAYALEEGALGKLAAPAPMSKKESLEQMADAELVGAEPAPAAVEATEYSAEFKVPGRVHLKSSRDSTKLYLNKLQMKAALEARTTPRLNPTAFLFVKTVNEGAAPIIPGAVAKYRDGAFVGNASLPLLRSGEETNLSFGADDRVKVSFQPLSVKKNNPTVGLFSDSTEERKHQIKVQNLHKDALPTMIFDQYPVSSDGDVKVQVINEDTTPGYTETQDKVQGTLVWSETFKPNEEKVYTLGFRVKFPKGRLLNGM